MGTTDERLVGLEAKLDDLKELMLVRFNHVDDRFNQIDSRFKQVDDRFGQVDSRLDRMDRRFLWILGMQFTTLLAIMAGMFGIIANLL